METRTRETIGMASGGISSFSRVERRGRRSLRNQAITMFADGRWSMDDGRSYFEVSPRRKTWPHAATARRSTLDPYGNAYPDRLESQETRIASAMAIRQVTRKDPP